MEQVASTGENHLLCGEIKDGFATFWQQRQKCAISSSRLKDLNGKLWWQEHSSTLLNRPIQPPTDALVSEAIASILILPLTFVLLRPWRPIEP